MGASVSAPFNDLGSLIRVCAARGPKATAVKHADVGTRSYADLEDRSSRLANALRGLGLVPGDRVAAWLTDSIQYVELYIAAAKASLVVVPINSRFTVHEAAYQIEDTEPRALVYTREQADAVEELPGRDELELIAAVQGDQAARGTAYETLLGAAAPTRLPPPSPADPFMICFTSGSTGRPKGAVLTHRSCMTLAATQLIALRIPLYGVNVQAVSMSFPATIVSHLIPHLAVGGTQILAPGKWDSERLLDIVEAERATHIYVPAPVVTEFTEAVRVKPNRWQTLTSILHAGSRHDPAALENLAELVSTRYLQGWGMTEISGGVATATSPQDVLARRENFFASAGRAVPGTMVKVIDDGGRELLADGTTVGELTIRSPSLFAGYWRRPEDTAAVVVDGWYRTGDLGSMDEDGYVYIADRGKNLIRSGGMNVYPAELELVLARCPGVAECAVIGLEHAHWGETPVAVVVRSVGSDLSADRVIAYMTERLASYKKPTSVLFVDELPRTTGGKIARPQVRELAERTAEAPA